MQQFITERGFSMLFNSFGFLMFFPLVITLYYIVSYQYRWMILLSASYFFYMIWNPACVLLLLISTAVDYFAGLKMGDIAEKAGRKKYLLLSIVSNLGLLFSFKYLNFFSQSVSDLFGLLGIAYRMPVMNLILPIGISFYTFQTLSYSIEVYRGRKEPERNFGYFALYVSFFPQLVAGPIERAEKLLPQLRKEHRFDYQRATDGLKLMLWGYFKKIVIADRLAILVNTVYNNPTHYSGIQLFVAMLFFIYQLYCDFSGYSDIAIGASRVMGIQLTQNFRQPFFSQTLNEFWGRWHITLYSWLKDYLLKPVHSALRFKSKEIRRYVAFFLTFAASGIWHGARWTFVIWGILQGLLIIFGHVTREYRHNMTKNLVPARLGFIRTGFRMLFTFGCAVLMGALFRSQTLSEAFYIFCNFTNGIKDWLRLDYLKSSLQTLGLTKGDFFIAGVSILFMEAVQIAQYRGVRIRDVYSRLPTALRWAVLYGFIFWILIFGEFGSKEFVYFQF